MDHETIYQALYVQGYGQTGRLQPAEMLAIYAEALRHGLRAVRRRPKRRGRVAQ